MLSLQFVLLGLVALMEDVHATCSPNTEIIFVTRSAIVSRECFCDSSSTACSWSPFADQSNILSSGISESLLLWQDNTGYGQYICMQDNSFIVSDVLILPESFIPLDLLYLQVMLKYVYRCQLVIYCLEILENKVEVHKKDQERRNNENQERQGNQEIEINVKFQNQNLKNDLVKDTEAIFTYIEDLNASSATTALLIILAGFQAVNCAINLLSASEISYGQAAAVLVRLLLWGFLLVFPFRKAAGVNIVSKRLQDLGWDVKRNSVAHDGDSGPITLTANMFGISVNPWLPFLVTMALLFTLMAGAKIKWYELKM